MLGSSELASLRSSRSRRLAIPGRAPLWSASACATPEKTSSTQASPKGTHCAFIASTASAASNGVQVSPNHSIELAAPAQSRRSCRTLDPCRRQTMTSTVRTTLAITVLLLLSSCDLKEQADVKFGDQGFKTAISLIELHKTRFGAYPEDLKQLQFTGDWDPIAVNSVEYHRSGAGYELNLTRGWVSKPTTLTYPKEFWQGLGLVKSNLKPT